MLRIQNIEPNVDKIFFKNREIILVGTAHISQASIDLTITTIREQKPDAVAVELCQSRFDSLKDPNRWRNTDILQVLRSGRIYILLLQLALASYQKKLGDSLKVRPGAEMLAAITTAEELSIPLVLADRDVKTTLRRAWANIGIGSIVRLFVSSLWEIIKDSTLSLIWFITGNKRPAAPSMKEEIERLKNSDALDALMKEFSEALPDVKVPLIDERDLYLVSKIVAGVPEGKIIVAILGAGHIPGMKKIIEQDLAINCAALEVIPPTTISAHILTNLFPIIFVLLLAIGFFLGGIQTAMSMVITWITYTVVSATIGSVISLAHPAAILVTAISAPFTTLYPFLTTGWTAGFIEALVKNPQGKDLESVLEEMISIKGLYRNRLAHIFLVMILTNIATSIGMVWGVRAIAKLL